MRPSQETLEPHELAGQMSKEEMGAFLTALMSKGRNPSASSQSQEEPSAIAQAHKNPELMRLIKENI